MALQIWLPLNGNLDNKGLSNLTITPNGGTAVYDDGKIGKGLSCNGSTNFRIPGLTLGKYASICHWGKTSTNSKMPWVLNCASSSILNLYASGVYYLNIGDGSNNPFKDDSGNNISVLLDNKWHHFAVTFDNQYAKLYIDGVYRGTSVTYRSPETNSSHNMIKLAGDFNSAHSYDWNGMLNDFRVYDHCLSLKEIKEISKALVVHYTLDLEDTPLYGMNLIANGWGGTDNWDSSNYISTNVPSSPVGITHSYSLTKTKAFIPIISDHSYTMSGYVYKGTSTQGTIYLVLVPFDIDKKQIHNNYVVFKSNSLTTLSQDLTPGDTIVHLTDASGWANPGTYDNQVAIFGYTDSTGYTYPDLTYTRRVYSYNKSSLDLTNNQVTLNNPYSGSEIIPAGTSVCISTDGATYYYVDSMASSNASDWTLMSKSFTPKDKVYLRYAHYVKVMGALYSGQWTAGITLRDNSTKGYIYDSSGYNNDGMFSSKGLDIYYLEPSSPKYTYTLKNTAYYPLRITSKPLNLNSPITNITISCWVNLTAWGSQTSGLWATSSLSTQPTDYQSTTCNHRDSTFDMRGTNNTSYRLTCNASDIPANVWKHVVFTHDSTNAKLYINGQFVRQLACPTPLTGFDYFYLGYSEAGGTVRQCKGSWSDLRIYMTTLSDDDILELYNTSTLVDNTQNIMSYSFDEDNSTIRELNPMRTITINTTTSVILPSGDYQISGHTRFNSSYIPVNPAGKTYYYDIEYSNTSGNQFYIGVERYDAHKVSGSNQECQYPINTTSAANHVRNTGTLNISTVTANGNPVAYIKIRILNDWSNSGNTSYIAKIHYFSIKEVSSISDPNINKNGVFNGNAFFESNNIASISKTSNIISNQFIEL